MAVGNARFATQLLLLSVPGAKCCATLMCEGGSDVLMATRKKAACTASTHETQAPGQRRSWWKPLTAMVVLAALVVLGYSVYLGKTVRVKFDGQRWGRTGADLRGHSICMGAAISAAQLKAELRFLGYREVIRSPARRNGHRVASVSPSHP